MERTHPACCSTIPARMTFPYFDSLSAKNKRIYLASDRVREIVLPEAALPGLAAKVRRLRGALGAASQRGTESACREITRGICEALGVAIPTVRVHEVRPSGDFAAGTREQPWSGELHGLYTRWDDGRARIEVWMRTAVNEQPVAFRTFLRTLAHEIGHHLDYVHLALVDSFHTEGFFARESSLVKQLLAAMPQAETVARRAEPAPPSNESRKDKLARLRERLGATRPLPEIAKPLAGPKAAATVSRTPTPSDAAPSPVAPTRSRASAPRSQLALSFEPAEAPSLDER